MNMHQAIVLYTIEYAIYITLIALIVMACMSIGSVSLVACIIMICYGCILLIIAFIGSGMISHAMVDYYLAAYKCKPYNIRRLGDTLARNGLTKILVLNVKRVLLGFLLTLCLIVPGVIYLIRTCMAEHLLIANPKMKASTALSASNKVMSGKTGSYFSLMMSMFGWWALGVFTLGLGFIFIMPYVNLCKTVYYKRNLQGDKTVYKTVVQPVSPPPTAPVQSVPGTPVQQPQQQVKPQQPQQQVVTQQPPDRPIKIENAVPPIAALGADDVAEMNAAMRDLNEEVRAVPDVPEVPISPVQSAKTKPQPMQKSTGDKRAIDDSDLVEIVTPLTTREVDESNVMSKKIDAMFAGANNADGVRHDYMAEAVKTSPNDFTTSEITPQPDMPASASPADDLPDSIMSDAEFAEFIKNFDVPKSEGSEFKPLTRSRSAQSDGDIKGESSIFDKPISVDMDRTYKEPAPEPVSVPRAERAEPARPARRTSASHNDFGHGETRTERLRREREQRLKQHGK